MARKSLVVLGLLLAPTLWAGAAEEVNQTDSMAPGHLIMPDANGIGLGADSAVSRDMMIRTMLWMVLMVGIVMALAWLTKRLLPRVGMHSGKEIRVLETTGLGPRRALHLVQVGSQQLLIGSTSEHITMLTAVNPIFPDVMSTRLNREEHK